MNRSQDARQAEWKASAIRVFGLVSLTLGGCLGVLILAMPFGFPLPLWYPGLPLLATMLALLLAANLMYVGWQTVSTGSIPVRPRSPVTRDILAKLRNTIASWGSVSTVA